MQEDADRNPSLATMATWIVFLFGSQKHLHVRTCGFLLAHESISPSKRLQNTLGIVGYLYILLTRSFGPQTSSSFSEQ